MVVVKCRSMNYCEAFGCVVTAASTGLGEPSCLVCRGLVAVSSAF